jgi:hypothetical protein
MYKFIEIPDTGKFSILNAETGKFVKMADRHAWTDMHEFMDGYKAKFPHLEGKEFADRIIKYVEGITPEQAEKYMPGFKASKKGIDVMCIHQLGGGKLPEDIVKAISWLHEMHPDIIRGHDSKVVQISTLFEALVKKEGKGEDPKARFGRVLRDVNEGKETGSKPHSLIDAMKAMLDDSLSVADFKKKFCQAEPVSPATAAAFRKILSAILNKGQEPTPHFQDN